MRMGERRAAVEAHVIYGFMRRFDDETRRRIAQGWAASSLDQESFAAKHGISPRTLREWVRFYGAGSRPAARARAIIDSAIAQLQALRAALDAEEACQPGAVGVGQVAVMAQPERHAGPAVRLKLLPPPADPAPSPRPLRSGGFFASMNDEP